MEFPFGERERERGERNGGMAAEEVYKERMASDIGRACLMRSDRI